MEVHTRRVKISLSKTVKLVSDCRSQTVLEAANSPDDADHKSRNADVELVAVSSQHSEGKATLLNEPRSPLPDSPVPDIEVLNPGPSRHMQNQRTPPSQLEHRPHPGNNNSKRMARDKARSKKRRALKREETRQQASSLSAPCPPSDPLHRAKLAQKHMKLAVVLPQPTAIPTGSFDNASTRFEGQNFVDLKQSVRSLQEWMDLGYDLVEWDGSSTLLLVDQEDKIIVVLGGNPKNSWSDVHAAAYLKMKQVGSIYDFSEMERVHSRGDFSAVSVGYTVTTGGLNGPYNRRIQSAANEKQMQQLLSDPSIASITGHANSLFSTWAPKLYQRYCDNATTVFEKKPGLKRNFANSVWATCAFNFGPRTVCKMHLDSKDLPYGLCAITASGTYDYKAGGHLVLSDMELVIQFPPGSTILLPSASLVHGNTPVSVNEKRLSITQYSSASLFRWVECGFQTVDSYNAALEAAALKNPQVREDKNKRAEERFRRGPEYYSTLDELHRGWTSYS